MDKVLVILGPTATGKTDLGLILAQKLKGEIIVCDSRQVYKGLDIGTGKDPLDTSLKVVKGAGYWQINRIKIWLYDLVEPEIQFNVKDYLDNVHPVIQDVLNRGKLPIIVGGTGLYLKALTEGLSALGIPINLKLHQELEQVELSQLQQELQARDLNRWSQLNNSERMNKRRLIRNLELIDIYPYKQDDKDDEHRIIEYDYLKIGLTAPREVLNQRIDQRVDKWIKKGLLEEGKKLLKNGLTLPRMDQLGLEYRYLAQYLSQQIDQQQLIDLLKLKNHQYAKRQMTWFKRDRDINWFDITDKTYIQQVEKTVKIWYHPGDEKPGSD